LEIMDTIKHVQDQEQLSLITITHDLEEVIQVDRVIVLNQGEIWTIGTPREVLEHGKALQEIGLDIPFIAQLSSALQERNIKLAVVNRGENLQEILHEKTYNAQL